jgi:endonuclease/exonuclease/phosphatase family metal-dependent hydrolase
LGVVAVLGLASALAVLLISGATEAAKGQSEPTANAAKKKKKDAVKVMIQNLYLGSDLDRAVSVGLNSRTDLFADEVGQILRNVNANDFNVRAGTIAKGIKKRKADVVGLQEATLFKLQTPTDGGGPPRGTPAPVPMIDYIDTLLYELNKKAKSKKACGKAAKKRKAQGKKPKPCYRGYRLVGFQQEADVEQIGDFDNDPGQNGKTFDLSDAAAQAALGQAAPSRWLDGNDDTPDVNLGEPPAAQCSDGIDNDGDGLIDYGPTPGVNETSGPGLGADPTQIGGLQFQLVGGVPSPSMPPWGCDSRVDNNEAARAPGTDPNGLPQDANFDHSAFARHFGSPDEGTPPCTQAEIAGTIPLLGAAGASACPTQVSYDSVGNGLDARGVTDCPDSSADAGPADGTPNWPFSGVGYAGARVPVCMFHGIDGDARLQIRDAIIARKGAGVKSSNVTGGNFAHQLQFTLFGTPVTFNRGWIAADFNVRGKKFHFVNTHIEDEETGTIREDQASELLSGPGAVSNTVLVGDLNSDPSIQPGPDPVNDFTESNIAFNRLTAGGYVPVSAPANTWGHAEILNNPNDNTFTKRIDWIMTNSPSITMKSSSVFNSFANGLWGSDHGGVLSVLRIPEGKKKK